MTIIPDPAPDPSPNFWRALFRGLLSLWWLFVVALAGATASYFGNHLPPFLAPVLPGVIAWARGLPLLAQIGLGAALLALLLGAGWLTYLAWKRREQVKTEQTEAEARRQTDAFEGAVDRRVGQPLERIQTGVTAIEAHIVQGEPLPLVSALDRASFRMGDRLAATFPYVRQPVAAAYQQAVATLRAASDGNHPKMGILTVGEANAGKTRLALEALIATLPDWDALIWLLGDRESKIPTAARLNGRNVAIFVDDVHAFAAGGEIASGSSSGGDARSAQASVAGPAATLRTLYQRVCQEAEHVVVVATCRREEKESADGSLGWLFEKLDTVAVPTFNNDERSGEAQRIIGEFRARGKVRDEWNGTIGSLVLGLGRLHEEYVELDKRHSPGVPVLHAMKLLRLGGIPTLTGKRVRAICDQILHEPTLAAQGKLWDEALAELDRVQFVFITPDDTGDTRLTIRKDDYFRYVVNDYPPAYQRDQHRAQLRNVFVALEDDDALFYLGNGYYFDEEYSSAIAAYNEAIRLNPEYATAYYNKGNTLDTLQRYDEAIAAYNEAIRLNPDDATAYNNKGTTLGKLQRYDEAIAAYNEAIRLNPEDATAYNNKGKTLGKLQRYDEAITAYNEAIRLNPADATAYYNKGTTLDTLQRYDEAITAYNEAIRLNPEYATAYNNMGDLLNKIGRYDEALSRCDYSLNLDPNSAVTWTTRAEILNNMHRYEEALVSVERALILGPNFVDPWRAKATALLALGREDEAQAAEEKARRLEE